MNSSPPVKYFLPSALIMAGLGWAGVILIGQYLPADAGGRWAMFFALMIAVTGTFMPVAAFLNRRFPTKPPASAGVVLRESIWVGVYVTTVAWLQYIYINFFEEALPLAMAVMLAIALLIIEWLLRLREKSQWKPERGASQ
jgi:uncharacterized membrane-anchored protein